MTNCGIRVWPIERIIVRLKELASEVGFAPSGDLLGRDRERMLGDILRWCLDHYYRS